MYSRVKMNLAGRGRQTWGTTGGVTRRGVVVAAGAVLVGVRGAVAGCSGTKQAVATGGGAGTHQLSVGSESMEPTIAEGAKITVDAVTPGTYQPHRQDIVVVVEDLSPGGNSLVIRRVIGIPGDTVSCDGAGSPLYLNGTALSEPYLYKGDSASTIQFDVKVPAGCLWLLGDHRAIALDCRYHLTDANHGAIQIASVVGIYHPPARPS